MAGQYGKPRNTLKESVNGTELPKFYGDNINGTEPSDRAPDPKRMAEAYARSSLTMNYMRATLAHNTSCLDKGIQLGRSTAKEDERMERRMASDHEIPLPGIFVSHEALFLHYEQPLTRVKPLPRSHDIAIDDSVYYNGSTHFIWIGDKTRQLDGAHVEYARGLSNPTTNALTSLSQTRSASHTKASPTKEIGVKLGQG